LGIEFEGGKPVEFDDKLANPFGGEPFPSKVRFRLKEVDRKRGVAKLRWTQTVASDDARRIMEKTLKDFAQRLGKPVADADLLKTLTIEDSADFAIEISSGWIQNFTHKRVTKTEGSSRADVVMVSRKKE
jgi:hypothetical protein